MASGNGRKEETAFRQPESRAKDYGGKQESRIVPDWPHPLGIARMRNGKTQKPASDAIRKPVSTTSLTKQPVTTA